ncbi:hypothetical protein H0H92_006845 [Tricholoma furcatifolium]|nr:hypothetical protein H0H92_006845 [Tricholoma furcatifolium]
MPGSPGLFFNPGCGGVAYPIPGVQKLLTRITSISKAVSTPLWQYQGEYVLQPAQPLTTQEWAVVDSSVRKNWAQEMWKSSYWGKGTRVRILLRRMHGRECTVEEFDSIIDDEKTYREEVSVDDIARALLRGEEKVAVWTMKCVGYDAAFQRGLAAKFADWVPPPKQPTKNTKKTKKDQKRARKKQVKKESEEDSDSDDIAPTKTTKRPVMGKKRKRGLESSDENEESDEY